MRRRWFELALNPLAPLLDRTARYVDLSRLIYFGICCGLLFLFGIILPAAVEENQDVLRFITLVPLAVTAFCLFMMAAGLGFLFRFTFFATENREVKRVVFKRFQYVFFLVLPVLLLLAASLRMYTMGRDFSAVANEAPFLELALIVCVPFGEQAAGFFRNPVLALPVLYFHLVCLLSAYRLWSYNFQERCQKEKRMLEEYQECRARITERKTYVRGSGKNRTTIYNVKYEYAGPSGTTHTDACSTADSGVTGYVGHLYHHPSIKHLDIKYDKNDARKNVILFNRIFGKGADTDHIRCEFKKRNIDEPGSYAVWGIWLIAGGAACFFSSAWISPPGFGAVMKLASVLAFCFSAFSFAHFFSLKGRGL
jgi:hypothetical protein